MASDDDTCTWWYMYMMYKLLCKSVCFLDLITDKWCLLQHYFAFSLPKFTQSFLIPVLICGLQQPASSSLNSSWSVWITVCIVSLSLSFFQVFCFNSALQHFEVPRFSMLSSLIHILHLHVCFICLILPLSFSIVLLLLLFLCAIINCPLLKNLFYWGFSIFSPIFCHLS